MPATLTTDPPPTNPIQSSRPARTIAQLECGIRGQARQCVIAAFGKGAAVTNVAWPPNAGPLPSSLWASSGADTYCFDLRAGADFGTRAVPQAGNLLGPNAAAGDEIASHVLPETGGTVVAADDTG